MNFERNKDPKQALQIGECRKRLFKDMEEAAQWFVKYPAEYTEGKVTDWNNHCDKDGNIIHSILPSDCGKLQQVKWVKWNLRMANNPNYDLGLKDSKAIVDRAWEIIRARIVAEEFIGNDLDHIIAFIEDIEKEDSALRRFNTNSALHREGWDQACYYIKQFIEGLKK